MRALLLLAILLAPLAAGAADGPDAAYASFHRAGLQADLDGMLEHATLAMRERIRAGHVRGDEARVLSTMLPGKYAIVGRAAAGTERVVLELDGTGGALAGAQGKMRGKVRLVREDEAWKVDQVDWLSVAPPKEPRHKPDLAR